MITSFDTMFFLDKMPVNGLSNDNAKFFNGRPVRICDVGDSRIKTSYAPDELTQSYALIEALFDAIAMMNDDEAQHVMDRIRLELDEERSARGM